jgi:RNA polymerase sigma-70 factor (ECF subfamily)
LYRLTASAEDAEEATLEVFLRVWRNAERFQYRSKVSTWLYRIAVNIARDLYSRRKSRPQEPWPDDEEASATISTGSAEQDALQALDADDRSRELHAALERLSDSDRELIVLYYFNDCDYDEIREITGLSYTVLKTRLARARQRLRHHLETARTDGRQ